MRESYTITEGQIKRAGAIGSAVILTSALVAGAVTDYRGWRTDLVNRTPFGSHSTSPRSSETTEPPADPTYATPEECFDAAKNILRKKGIDTDSLEDWGKSAFAPIGEKKSNVPTPAWRIAKSQWGTDLGIPGSKDMDEIKKKLTGSGRFVDVTDYFSQEVNKQCIPNGVIVIYRDQGKTEVPYIGVALGQTPTYNDRATIAGTDVVNGATGGIADSAKLQSIFAFAPK